MLPQAVNPNAEQGPINPEAEARANAVPIDNDVEVVDTVEEANARRGRNYGIAFGAFIVITVILAIIL